MSKFVRVYTPALTDEIFREEEIMFMRRDDDFLEVEEGDIQRAMSLLPEAVRYSDSLVVHKGEVSTKESPSGVGTSPRSIWREIAEEYHALIKLYNLGSDPSPVRATEGEYHVNFFSVPKEILPEGGYLDYFDYTPAFQFGDIVLSRDSEEEQFYGFSADWLRERVSEYEGDIEFNMVEDDNNRAFAVYSPFNMWIAFRSGENRSLSPINETRDALKDLFSKLFLSTNDLVPDIREFMQEQKRVEREKTLSRWATLVAGRHDERVKGIEEDILKHNEDLDRVRAEQVELLRAIPSMQQVLSLMQNVRPDVDALADEFDQIHESPWIDRVEITEDGNSMIAYTHTLTMDGDEDIRSTNEEVLETWAGMVVPIGKFKITLSPSGSIKLENLTNQKQRASTGDEPGSSWHHPHVPVEGAPCFGTIERSLPQFLAKHEFAGCLHLLVQFLCCCNADDPWGVQINLWREDAYPKSTPGPLLTTGGEEPVEATE